MNRFFTLVLFLLAGCGGSDDPIEPNVTTQPVLAPACQASGTCL